VNKRGEIMIKQKNITTITSFFSKSAADAVGLSKESKRIYDALTGEKAENPGETCLKKQKMSDQSSTAGTAVNLSATTRQTPGFSVNAVVVDIESDAQSTNDKADKRQPTFTPFFQDSFPLAASSKLKPGQALSMFVESDIEAKIPFILSTDTKSVEEPNLYSFCKHLHSTMLEVWPADSPTCRLSRLTKEQLQHLQRGCCVHEEVMDQLRGLLCTILGARYLDSSALMYPADGPGPETAAAKTLVLACTFSAMAAAGDLRFAEKWKRENTLDAFSQILWLKQGKAHFTTVRMDLHKSSSDDKVTAVHVRLADSSHRGQPSSRRLTAFKCLLRMVSMIAVFIRRTTRRRRFMNAMVHLLVNGRGMQPGCAPTFCSLSIRR
jgi:hypothetical protein